MTVTSSGVRWLSKAGGGTTKLQQNRKTDSMVLNAWLDNSRIIFLHENYEISLLFTIHIKVLRCSPHFLE